MATPKAYHGSCHCGLVKYQVKLNLPSGPITNEAEAARAFGPGKLRIYKCNCSTCHKMGYFHCRPADPENDFILTSPSTIEELGDYRAFSKKQGWYFCKNCGVRIVGVGGDWEQVDLDVEKWAGREGGNGEKKKVWLVRPMMLPSDDPNEKQKPFHYVSVNAVTLEPGERGVNLIEWHEKAWVGYVQRRDESDGRKERIGKPYPCGMY